ncbi:MAG: tRNA (adenosine(37)-N6)-threonylcarbamoyltransferase complex dimerization subunit type 1 TsaB [Lachnospiraceae bacterium]|nr:tRNA (adenosine(37)-N6)-threonylcarbamoyltransferase complex dimerization subunit type 1 TsaB [Lachnospiraceae bacterium]
MKILALDSSGLVASVAIVEDSVMTAEYTVNYKKTHSQTLLPMLSEICRMTELGLETVDAIAVAKGPGSFTGLRIGSATVKGLGLALDKPIIPVPTVDALAYNAWGYNGVVCPMMDARRMQVYTGIYAFSDGFQVLLPQCAIAVEELADRLNSLWKQPELDRLRIKKQVIFLGDGVPVYRDLLKEKLQVPFEFAPAHMGRQRAGALGVLAQSYYEQGILESAMEHKPEYLRLSQAERERLAAEKKKEAAAEKGTIRPMTLADVDAVCELEAAVFSMPWKKPDFLEMVERDTMSYLVVEEDGKVIGGAGLREIAGDIELTNVAVAPEYRRKGYGRSLMEAVLLEGKRLGGTQMTLEVRKSNLSAIRLYEAAGFQTEGLRKDFYEKPTEDALIMWRRSL